MAASQDALNQLQQTQAGARSAADILSGQSQKYGVQAAQDTVQGLRGAITNTTKLLNQVAPSVMGRTANSLVTSAQANRQVQNEQAPIAQQLSQQSQDYGTANDSFNYAQQQAKDAANMEYTDQQNKLSYLQNLYSTLFEREETARKAAAEEAARREETRRFNEQLALQKAAESRAASSKAASSAGGYSLGAPARPSVSVESLFNGYNPKNANQQYYTEKVVIPQLMNQLGWSKDQAAKAAYNYRKAKFGE